MAFRAVMWAFEKWVFDLPVYFAVSAYAIRTT
jgi:aarF domain-containing kinase